MFVHLFKDELNEYLYEADLAGLRMGVSNTANGISVSIRFDYMEKINEICNKNLKYISYQSVDTVIDSKYCLQKS